MHNQLNYTLRILKKNSPEELFLLLKYYIAMKVYLIFLVTFFTAVMYVYTKESNNINVNTLFGHLCFCRHYLLNVFQLGCVISHNISLQVEPGLNNSLFFFKLIESIYKSGQEISICWFTLPNGYKSQQATTNWKGNASPPPPSIFQGLPKIKSSIDI